MNATDVENKLYVLINSHLRGDLSRGQLLKTLRKDILKLNQSKYCKLCNLGRNTLVDLERDQGEPSESAVNKAFAPFGLKTAIVRPEREFLQKCLASGISHTS